MASASPDRQPIRRLSIATNVAMQLALAVLLLVVVNYLSFRHHWRWDLSRGQRFSLAPQTQTYLDELHGKTEVVAVFPRGTPEEKEVRLLIEAFKHHGRSHLVLESIDLAQESDRRIAAEKKYGLTLRENGLIVSKELPPPKNKAAEAGTTAPEKGQRRTRFIPESALFAYEEHAGQPRMTQFFGEDQLTSAIINVNQKASPVVYLLTGNIGTLPSAGTPQQPITAQNVLYDIFSKQDITFRELNLTGRAAIPEDASALFALRPGRDFTEREMSLISSWWKEKKAAGLLFLLDPEADTPRLDDFLASVGVRPRLDRVINVMPSARGPQVEYLVPVAYNPAFEITKPFGGRGVVFPEQTRSLELETEPNRLRQAMVDVNWLAVANPEYWSEANYDEPSPHRDASDIGYPEPIVVAAAVERGAQKDERLGSTSSRLVVAGNPALIDPQPGTSSVAAYDFVSSSLNWVLNREELIGITSREIDSYQIQMSSANTTRIFWIVLGLLPGAVLMFALFMWSARRA